MDIMSIHFLNVIKIFEGHYQRGWKLSDQVPKSGLYGHLDTYSTMEILEHILQPVWKMKVECSESCLITNVFNMKKVFKDYLVHPYFSYKPKWSKELQKSWVLWAVMF